MKGHGIPDIRSHVNWQASKHVNHVNFGRTRVLVSTHDPGLATIGVMDIEDGKVSGVQSIFVGNVFAALGNPPSTPVVPV